jgi:hypothetical protein
MIGGCRRSLLQEVPRGRPACRWADTRLKEDRGPRMLEKLAKVPWASLPQPNWNKPDEVPMSLRSLASCSSEEEADKAYHRYLYAVGNNHAGSYFPVVLSTISFLGEILRDGSELSRKATLDAHIDLLGSFGPEPGFEFLEVNDGGRAEVSALLRRQVGHPSPLIRGIAEGAERNSGSARLARELLELLDEGEAAQQGNAPDGASRRR